MPALVVVGRPAGPGRVFVHLAPPCPDVRETVGICPPIKTASMLLKWQEVTKMGDIVKQHKPFELNRYEFGFLAVMWHRWRRHDPHRLQHPRVNALGERITKHWEDVYRSDVF